MSLTAQHTKGKKSREY